MISESQRQRAAQYQALRQRYLSARSQSLGQIADVDRQPLTIGYAVVPALMAASLVILALSMLSDLLLLITGNRLWASVSFWLILSGVLGSVATLVPVVIDWLSLPAGSRVRAVGLWYTLGSFAVIALFVQGWMLRLGSVEHPGTLAIVLTCMGAGVTLPTGWLGGELVDRLRGESSSGSLAAHPSRSLRVYQLGALPVEDEPEIRRQAGG